MKMRRAGLVLVTAAMLALLLAFAAYAQTTDQSTMQSQSSVTATAGTTTTPSACPPGTAMGTTGAMAGQTTATTTVSTMTAPSMTGYAGLWRSTGAAQRLHGHIVSIDRFYPGGPGTAPGVEVTLRVAPGGDEGTPDWQLGDQPPYKTVQLGPEWFVDQNLGHLRIGQPMTVIGAPAMWQGREVFLAQDVRVSRHHVAMRTDTGLPMWAGGWPNWGQTSAIASVSGAVAYNPNTVQTVYGRIDRVWTADTGTGAGPTQMVTLRQPDNTRLTVALAPAAFVSQNNLPLAIGDQAIVTGSLVMANGQPLLLASQFQEGSQQLTLRDSTGNPAWAVAMAAPPSVATAQATGPAASASATIGQPGSGVPYGPSNQPNTGAAMPGNQANAGAESY